jgi:hypothetical protein
VSDKIKTGAIPEREDIKKNTDEIPPVEEEILEKAFVGCELFCVYNWEC